MIELEQDPTSSLVCPHCNVASRVSDWHTEYNDPLSGTNYCICYSCDKKMSFDVEVVTVFNNIQKLPDDAVIF